MWGGDMTKFYSALRNAFFDGELEEEYQSSGTWPDDAVEVSDAIFLEFGCSCPPSGCLRVAGPSGAPIWAEVPALSEAQAWDSYQASALTALAASDRTILRCYENSVVVPSAWISYRKSLRAIVSATTGDASQPFPVQPPYPAGT
ncbi:hypothetical protein PCAR4_40277 [Paraburkholderia caribensis]|nr:hypothetical protein PCAR4_40277 [Paraburkholderia caribensis]